jgi:hypothetical protein
MIYEHWFPILLENMPFRTSKQTRSDLNARDHLLAYVMLGGNLQTTDSAI